MNLPSLFTYLYFRSVLLFTRWTSFFWNPHSQVDSAPSPHDAALQQSYGHPFDITLSIRSCSCIVQSRTELMFADFNKIWWYLCLQHSSFLYVEAPDFDIKDVHYNFTGRILCTCSDDLKDHSRNQWYPHTIYGRMGW